jgi:ABC-2 type transport system ATP-binding protein
MELRLGFSIATTIDPEILIIDELLAGGDASFVEKALSRMHQLIQSSKIFITVSHDNNQIKTLCNKVLYLKNRKVAYFGKDVAYAINAYMKDHKPE